MAGHLSFAPFRMLAAGLLLLVLAAPAAARLLRVGGATATTHPVENVIGLLKDLGSKAEEEGKAEELSYEKFEHWCARSTKSLSETIAESKTKLQSLQDLIDARTTTVDVLDKEVEAQKKLIDDLEKSQSAADGVRKAGADLFKEEEASLTGTIDAVQNALKELSGTKKDVDPALLQSHMGNILAQVGSRATPAQRSLLETLIAAPRARPDLEADGDYKDHVDEYDFKSDNIVEMLKDLETKFEDALRKTSKEETNAVNAYDLAKAANQDASQASISSKEEKEGLSNDASAEKSEAEGHHKDTSEDLGADQGTLSSTVQACEVKAAEWAERSKTRAGEQEAIKVAIKILADVADVRTEQPENPVPPASPVFLQLDNSNPDVQRAVKLLRYEARTSRSQAIAQLAELVAKTEGPFDQVKNKIEKMIFHLMNEQKEEDDHKNWCDKELSKTDAMLENHDDKLEELKDKINLAKAKAQKLKEGITKADAKVAEITAHMEEATEIREEGKEENTLAVKDAEAAQKALSEATAVLKDFYKESGMMKKESYELLQREPVKLPDDPSTWDASYTGVADPADQPGGIVTILETTSADFAKMEAETLAQEETDQNEYEQEMKDCKIESARRAKESEMKTQEREEVVQKQTAMEATRKRVKEERKATDQYLKDLQPACVEGGSTYKDRKDARTGEINSLKESKKILRDAFDNIDRSK